MDIADTESWSKLSLRMLLSWAWLSLLLGESGTWLVAALSAPRLGASSCVPVGAKETRITLSVKSGTVPILSRLNWEEKPLFVLFAWNANYCLICKLNWYKVELFKWEPRRFLWSIGMPQCFNYISDYRRIPCQRCSLFAHLFSFILNNSLKSQ